MLGPDQGNDRLGSSLPVENLTLAIHNMLLQIHGHGLSSAEILHRLRNLHPQLLTELEKRVDCVAGRKSNGGIIRDINPLRTELQRSQRLDRKERLELKTDAVLIGQGIVRGHIGRGLLGYENLLYTVHTQIFTLLSCA